MRRLLFLLAMATTGIQAGPLVLTGQFSADDQLAWFRVTINAPGTLTVRSAGYGGDSAFSIAAGGFDTVLSLFSSTGVLLGLNNDGSCPPATADPVSGACWDAMLSMSLVAGEYLVVLSQYENTPYGPFLSDGFTRVGEGNYTSLVSGYPGGPFVDLSGSARTGSWALIFDGMNTVNEVPEPAGWGLIALAACGLGTIRLRRQSAAPLG